ncbi:isocitrate/isopropylmalate dehydrogenase family protein [Clostridiaceae bacterium 35-E11]
MIHVTLIPGDGIGPEVAFAAQKVIDSTGIKIHWDIVNGGTRAYENTGHYIPEELLRSIEKNKLVLKGPITTPVGKGFRSINVALRQKYDLFANVRPIKTLPGAKTLFKDIDFVVVRENTEGLYTGIEHMVTPGVAESIKVITEKASLRIAEYAFEYAKKHGRKKVTAVHKANIMKVSDGLFLTCAQKIASQYPDIVYEEVIVDNMCMQLVMHPENYDVLVLPNLYGDIVSDLGAGLVGGLGMVPGANIGKDIAIFEAVHGSAPDIAGKNMANPIACILSGAMLLHYIGESKAGKAVERAVESLLQDKKILTTDLGGSATTEEVTNKICKNMSKAL